MRTFLSLCFVLLASGIALTNIQPLQAGAAGITQGGVNGWQTAPLPPPTPPTNTDETVLTQLNRPFRLNVHQWVTLSDTPDAFSVELAALVSDSRCPADVNCVVAGQVEFQLLLRSDNVISPRHFTIGTYPINEQNKVRYAGYEIELVEVQPPAPAHTQRLKPGAYVATLVVRRDDILTPEVTATPTNTPTPTPTPRHGQVPSQPSALNQPFPLHVGETADLQDVDIQITLRSVTDDSGCLTATDCSVMVANGTLVLQRGNEREILTFITSITPQQSFDYEFAGYVVELVHLEKERNDDPVATFIVKRPTSTVEIPAPQRVARCPDFSRFDAAAILQEAVDKEAIANLVFGPLASDATSAAGLCGYVSSVHSEDRPIDEQVPHLASAVAADRAVVAAVIDSTNSNEILQLATLITAGDEAVDAAMLLQLQTELTVGLYDNVIGDLTAIATARQRDTVIPITEIGEGGLWLWRPVADGYFALLLVRDGERFRVVTALLNGEAEEETVFDYAIVIAARLE